MTVTETQQVRMLERLREAGKQTVTSGQLRAGGIDLRVTLSYSGYRLGQVGLKSRFPPSDPRAPRRRRLASGAAEWRRRPTISTFVVAVPRSQQEGVSSSLLAAQLQTVPLPNIPDDLVPSAGFPLTYVRIPHKARGDTGSFHNLWPDISFMYRSRGISARLPSDLGRRSTCSAASGLKSSRASFG